MSFIWNYTLTLLRVSSRYRNGLTFWSHRFSQAVHLMGRFGPGMTLLASQIINPTQHQNLIFTDTLISVLLSCFTGFMLFLFVCFWFLVNFGSNPSLHRADTLFLTDSNRDFGFGYDQNIGNLLWMVGPVFYQMRDDSEFSLFISSCCFQSFCLSPCVQSLCVISIGIRGSIWEPVCDCVYSSVLLILISLRPHL